MTDPSGAQGSPRPQLPRRDPAELGAQLRSRERAAIDAHLRAR